MLHTNDWGIINNLDRIKSSSRAQQAFGCCKVSATVESGRVRRRNVEFVYDGDLQEVHLGCDNDHMVRFDFHPVGFLECQRFAGNLESIVRNGTPC